MAKLSFHYYAINLLLVIDIAFIQEPWIYKGRIRGLTVLEGHFKLQGKFKRISCCYLAGPSFIFLWQLGSKLYQASNWPLSTHKQIEQSILSAGNLPSSVYLNHTRRRRLETSTQISWGAEFLCFCLCVHIKWCIKTVF